MYLEGMTLQEIGAALDAQNVPSPQIQMARNKKVTRKIKWPATTIRSILVNPLYIGKLTLKLSGVEKKMEVPPIVSEEDFQKVQEKIKASVKFPGRQRRSTPNILIRKIYDRASGERLLCRTTTSWCVPYGYRMNEQKSQYEVADEAKYVKLIYQWYLMGVSTNEIARRLEFLEVPRPNEHLNRRLHEGHDTTFNKWHSSSVIRILDSQVYIGNLVTGKTRTASYKGIGLHPVDKEEWHIVENAHEAIILKSDFEIVQEKRNRNKERRNNATPMKQSLQKMSIIRHKRQSAMLLRSSTKPKMILL